MPKSLGGVGMLIALLASSGLAFFWPMLPIVSLEQTAFDPFRLNALGLQLLVSVTMLCLGMVVRREELAELRHAPWSVLLGLVAQCGCMPIFAWLAATTLQLDGDLAAGVILVGCVPGAMASNVLTMTARGNVSYSVCLTAVATLASPITVPLLLALFTTAESGAPPIEPLKTSWTLLTTVVIPILVGFACKELWPKVQSTSSVIAPPLASVALLWIIASVVAGNRDRLSQISVSVFSALLLLNLAGYFAGIVVGELARMTKPMRRALALEVGMQNAGVGTFLAVSIYGEGTLAQIPTAAYTFGCMLTGTMLAAFWSRSSASENSTLANRPDRDSQPKHDVESN